MKNVWLLILIFLSACTTLEDLSPPTEKMSLTAIDDIFYYAELGIPRKKHLIGTTKGKFNLAGENESGYYFLSENSTYFVITDTEMKYYEEHKSLPDSVINKSPYGIWYPKKKTTKNPHFFLILKSDYENARKQGGPTHVLAASAVDGAIVDGFDIDKNLLDSAIKIETSPR